MDQLGTMLVQLMVCINGRYRAVVVYRRANTTKKGAIKEMQEFLNQNPRLATPKLLRTPMWQAEPEALIEDWNDRD